MMSSQVPRDLWFAAVSFASTASAQEDGGLEMLEALLASAYCSVRTALCYRANRVVNSIECTRRVADDAPDALQTSPLCSGIST